MNQPTNGRSRDVIPVGMWSSDCNQIILYIHVCVENDTIIIHVTSETFTIFVSVTATCCQFLNIFRPSKSQFIRGKNKKGEEENEILQKQ